MPELEIKDTLTAFVKIFNEIGPLSEETVIPFLSRMADMFNHIEAHYMANKAEIEALKIRLEKLERKGE